jgi:hypothetical protein
METELNNVVDNRPLKGSLSRFNRAFRECGHEFTAHASPFLAGRPVRLSRTILFKRDDVLWLREANSVLDYCLGVCEGTTCGSYRKTSARAPKCSNGMSSTFIPVLLKLQLYFYGFGNTTHGFTLAHGYVA